MKEKKILISKVNGKIQHLSDIYPVIETNTILNKTITGIGATFSEIKAPRHSIIIEPTKPVIYGKTHDSKHKGDNLKGVYQGVYQDEITEYIENSLNQNKWIKILTTPESFRKVRDAFDSLDIDIRYDGYFLLFDECQKIVKDCDYRLDITLPMDLFFECRQKAIVSATPPKRLSDPRLSDFTLVNIVPDFNYHIDVNLQTTNNVLQRTREIIKLLEQEERPIFIFVNSTDMIYSLMKNLELTEQSAVFCSEKSVDKLKGLKFSKAFEHWDEKQMKRYNWMTSRFYSALDIELSVPPIVLMITDCFMAEYTMFDPYMDAVQIVGRFRNGVSSVYHISNYDKRIFPVTEDDLIVNFRCAENVYKYLGVMADSVTTEPEKKAFLEAQAVIPYSRFLNEQDNVNYFLVDNYIDEELTKASYRKDTEVSTAYESCGYFNVTHENHIYKIGEFDRLKIENTRISYKEKRKLIVEQLEQLGVCETEAEQQYKRDLQAADFLIVEAYDVLGKDMIEQLKYNRSAMKKAIIVKRHKKQSTSTDIIKLINVTFKANHWYSAKTIKQELNNIFKTFNVPHPKAITSHTIKDYFVADEKKKKGKRGYLLLKPLFI